MTTHTRTFRRLRLSYKRLLAGFNLLLTIGVSMSARANPLPSEASDVSLDEPSVEVEERERSLDYPIRYVLAYQAFGLFYLNALDRDITNFDTFSWDTFTEGFSRGPEDDGDGAFWNYLMHPLWGSETYLRARSQNFEWWESFLFSAASSIVWEYGMENFVTQPSTPDLIITPLAGSVLGELRFRLKRHFLQSGYEHRNTYLILIDPLQAFTEYLGRSFGKDWSEPAYTGLRPPERTTYLDLTPTVNSEGQLGLAMRFQHSF
ncbi:MAG: DUF3943 domain-containing protein [Verrucomicrobiota bacterium]